MNKGKAPLFGRISFKDKRAGDSIISMQKDFTDLWNKIKHLSTKNVYRSMALGEMQKASMLMARAISMSAWELENEHKMPENDPDGGAKQYGAFHVRTIPSSQAIKEEEARVAQKRATKITVKKKTEKIMVSPV